MEGARGRCAQRAPTIRGARGARGARSSTPSSRVLLAPSSGSMTKPQNAKNAPLFNTPGRSGERANAKAPLSLRASRGRISSTPPSFALS